MTKPTPRRHSAAWPAAVTAYAAGFWLAGIATGRPEFPWCAASVGLYALALWCAHTAQRLASRARSGARRVTGGDPPGP